MTQAIFIISIIGLLLSIYALYVERKNKREKLYKPICDISDKISCTKAFSSPYGKFIGLPNSLMGIIFYLIVIALAFYNQTQHLLYLSIVAMLGSLYLAYTSYIKMKNFCLVCSAIYLVNLLLLIFSYLMV